MRRSQLAPILSHLLTISFVVSLIFAAYYLGREKYLEAIVPESVNPCSESASKVVRLSQDSQWPVERSYDERCPPDSPDGPESVGEESSP